MQVGFRRYRINDAKRMRLTSRGRRLKEWNSARSPARQKVMWR